MIEHSTGNRKVLGSISSGMEAFLFSQNLFSKNPFYCAETVSNSALNRRRILFSIDCEQTRYATFIYDHQNHFEDFFIFSETAAEFERL